MAKFDEGEFMGRLATEIFNSYGRVWGWSPEKCQFLVEDYQDEPREEEGRERDE